MVRGSIAVMATVITLILTTPALAQRTKVKPGWNLFSPQQDIEIGQEVSKQAEQQIVLLKDKKADDYLDRLGHKLASKAPGEKFPYQFKGVNDSSINAFALPGGFLYINRGTIEAADNEAQLAGVIGHEIGHAALRHGTNQMTKASALETLASLGGAMGGKSVVGLLGQLGANFGAQSILLKYSRDAERQADIVGTQILYDNNYDPRQMAEFFVKLEEESRKSGSRPIQFFSSHPNPENRVTAVNAEVTKMGGRSGNLQSDSAEFRDVQRYVRSLPPAPKPPTPQQSSGTGTAKQQGQRPAAPSNRLQNYSGSSLSIGYPDNWNSYGQGESFTLAPEAGLVSDGKGNTALAYGAIVAIFQPPAGNSGKADLDTGTTQLIENLQSSNPDMRITKNPSRIRLDGQPALASTLSNPSPLGGKEVDTLVTVLRPEGLLYLIFVVPEQELAGYQRTFQDMTNSVRFTRR
jgi:beta-barrel assembly-enhancing protease